MSGLLGGRSLERIRHWFSGIRSWFLASSRIDIFSLTFPIRTRMFGPRARKGTRFMIVYLQKINRNIVQLINRLSMWKTNWSASVNHLNTTGM